MKSKHLLNIILVQMRKVFTALYINLEGSLLNGSHLSQTRLEKAALLRTWSCTERILRAHKQSPGLIFLADDCPELI